LNWVQIFLRVHFNPFTMNSFIVGLGSSLAFLVSGVLYFSMSERVRATYGSKLVWFVLAKAAVVSVWWAGWIGMFCARCGQQIPDASEICPLCGREANVKLEPTGNAMAAAAAPAVAAEQPGAPSLAPIRKDLQGVGGWLLVFCVGLVLLRPLLVLSQAINAPNIDSLDMGLEISLAVFGIVVGIFVWNVRPVAFTLLWTYFALVVVLAILGIIGFAAEEQSRPQDLMVSVRSLVYVVIWFAYFHSSERVRATFGRNM
jgi:Protein of unknown function (DUF2569)